MNHPKFIESYQVEESIRIQRVEIQCCIIIDDGAHGIGVQNVTSIYNVATLISFFSLYLARRLATGETFIRW